MTPVKPKRTFEKLMLTAQGLSVLLQPVVPVGKWNMCLGLASGAIGIISSIWGEKLARPRNPHERKSDLTPTKPMRAPKAKK